MTSDALLAPIEHLSRKMRNPRGALEYTPARNGRDDETRTLVVSRYHPRIFAVSLVANISVLTTDVRWVTARHWQTVHFWLSPDATRLVPLAFLYEVVGRVVCRLPDVEQDPEPLDDGTLANSVHECVTDWAPVVKAIWAIHRRAVTSITPPPLPRTLSDLIGEPPR